MIQKLLKKIDKKNRPLLLAFAVFILVFLVFSYKSEKPVQNAEKVYADTLIPKGFVLVPVELANVETISALIDQFGVIDLYAGSPTSRGSKRIAAKVKILQAPLNPQQYAVLVPEYLSNEIMRTPGPFWAVVQNRQTTYEQKAEAVAKPIAIEYYKGE